MSDDVQASAPADAPDMFDGTEAAPPGHATDACIEVDCILIASAEVRTKMVGRDEHPVPVLCIDARPANGARRSIHADLVFTEATRHLAEAKAAALRKGARITLTTPVADMRVVFPHVQSVAIQQQ